MWTFECLAMTVVEHCGSLTASGALVRNVQEKRIGGGEMMEEVMTN